MDWTQIEKDFTKALDINPQMHPKIITNWFKQRIESELPPQPPEKLNEEERNVNVTADIKAVYERKT